MDVEKHLDVLEERDRLQERVAAAEHPIEVIPTTAADELAEALERITRANECELSVHGGYGCLTLQAPMLCPRCEARTALNHYRGRQ